MNGDQISMQNQIEETLVENTKDEFYVDDIQEEDLKNQLLRAQSDGQDPFLKNLEPIRWGMLIFVMLSAYSACGIWVAYMGIEHQAEQYYKVSKFKILMFGNTYMIGYIAFGFISAFLMHWNFQYSLYFANVLNFTCATIRWVAGRNWGLSFGATFLAAIGETFFLECPVFFAQTWFHTKERLLVVTLVVQVTYMANATLYFMSPLIANSKDNWQAVETVNKAFFFLALIPFVLGWFVIRNKPKKKPNLSAGIDKGSFSSNFKRLIKNRSYLAAIIIFGINIGQTYTVCPAIEIILEEVKLTPIETGLLGLIMNLCGIISGFSATMFINKVPGSRKYFDTIIKGSTAMTFLSLLVFGLVTTFTKEKWVFFMMAGLIGFFMILSVPFSCTAIEELSFPVDENLAQNGLFLMGNIFSFIAVSILGIQNLNKYLKYHLLTIIHLPVFIYVVFFYQTTFKKSNREGKTYSSFN